MKKMSRLILAFIGIMALVSLVSVFDSLRLFYSPEPTQTDIPETEYRTYLTQADSLFDIRQYDPASKLYAEYSLAMRYGNEANIDTKQADNRLLACELILLLSSN